MKRKSQDPSGSSFQARLQEALGDAYRIEEELGGAGMSRVFVAHEPAVDRRVVVKVLPPEMAAGANVERFRREIRLAARLQHPLVVPMLTAGASGDLLYYVMPLIRGESLRSRVEREGALPVPEAVTLLRDVAEALAYAHEEGVVHRDVKPDNVLVSGAHALVMDFGVATAVGAATGEARLTSVGLAVGSPAYMAPEQAAGDTGLDHRADIYALGVLAYELLAGRPPFADLTAQAVLGAHISEAPVPLSEHRTSVPPALEELVMRCLAKDPAERFQSADEVRAELHRVGADFSGARRTFRRSNPYRVATLFGAAAVVALAVVYGVMVQAGLPDWVFAGAVVLLAVGFPVVLLTGWVERRRAASRGMGKDPEPSGLGGRITWSWTLRGGALGFAGLGALTVGFLALRALGVPPFATLLTAGALDRHDPVILADFRNVTDDPGMGETVTELLRMDLARSGVISLVEPVQVAEALERMERELGTPLTPETAREMAIREGVKAYVAGEVRQVGSRLALSAQVVGAGSGESLVAVATVAEDDDDLIRAVDQLGRQLRERMGESLRTLRAEPPLAQVTTSSLDALRLYARGVRFGSEERDWERAIALLEEAVRVDSTFGSAHRLIAIGYRVLPGPEAARRSVEAIERAYALRHRMSDPERYLVEGFHARVVEGDMEKVLTANLALLEREPRHAGALSNVAGIYAGMGRPAEAEAAYRAAMETGFAGPGVYGAFIGHLLSMGRAPAADTVLKLVGERLPDSPRRTQWALAIARARRDLPAMEAHARELLSAPPGFHSDGYFNLGRVAEIRGRLREAAELQDTAHRLAFADEEVARLWLDFRFLSLISYFLGDHPDRAAEIEALWHRGRQVMAEWPPHQRPGFTYLLAYAGQLEAAREDLEERRASLPASPGSWGPLWPRAVLAFQEAVITTAEGPPQEAVRILREACDPVRLQYAICGALPWLAEAYDQAGVADSAIAVYERYLALEAEDMGSFDPWFYTPVHRRLAELYDARGDRARAAEYYARFVELWRDADPELQPQVQSARERLAALAPEREGAG
jgi:eukaryotic-like serine/threonine-protein kinase